jgi:cyclophilin family peptidyl-prolyl cis-trans isomerase
MGTEKRERQKAAKAAKRESEAADLKRAKTMQTVKRAAIIIGLVAIVMIGLSFLGADDDPTLAQPATTTEATSTSTSEADATTTTEADSGVDPFTPIDPVCPPEDASGPVQKQFTSAPPICISEDATYTAVLDTTLGEMTIELDQSVDMASVNNFVFLARHHYYDGVNFHRVIQDFMVQGGDPIGDPPGTGGPGYAFTGEQPDIDEYPIGAFAMANTGTPESNGSQFFIVTGENGQGLPNLYSLMGVLTEGQDVAEAISLVDTAPGDAPLDDVIINTIEIIQS